MWRNFWKIFKKEGFGLKCWDTQYKNFFCFNQKNLFTLIETGGFQLAKVPQFPAGLVGGGEASETREGLRPARAAAPHKDDSKK